MAYIEYIKELKEYKLPLKPIEVVDSLHLYNYDEYDNTNNGFVTIPKTDLIKIIDVLMELKIINEKLDIKEIPSQHSRDIRITYSKNEHKDVSEEILQEIGMFSLIVKELRHLNEEEKKAGFMPVVPEDENMLDEFHKYKEEYEWKSVTITFKNTNRKQASFSNSDLLKAFKSSWDNAREKKKKELENKYGCSFKYIGIKKRPKNETINTFFYFAEVPTILEYLNNYTQLKYLSSTDDVYNIIEEDGDYASSEQLSLIVSLFEIANLYVDKEDSNSDRAQLIRKYFKYHANKS